MNCLKQHKILNASHLNDKWIYLKVFKINIYKTVVSKIDIYYTQLFSNNSTLYDFSEVGITINNIVHMDIPPGIYKNLYTKTYAQPYETWFFLKMFSSCLCYM